MALLRTTRLLISEKSGTYTIKRSYTIIWQVRVDMTGIAGSLKPYLFARPNPISVIISLIISWQTIAIFLFCMLRFAN